MWWLTERMPKGWSADPELTWYAAVHWYQIPAYPDRQGTAPIHYAFGAFARTRELAIESVRAENAQVKQFAQERADGIAKILKQLQQQAQGAAKA